MNDMAKILCGSDDDDCLRELGEVLKPYRDLHGAGEDIDISVDFDRKVFPLISSISDPRLLGQGRHQGYEMLI
jgi:hypothetical protein